MLISLSSRRANVLLPVAQCSQSRLSFSRKAKPLGELVNTTNPSPLSGRAAASEYHPGRFLPVCETSRSPDPVRWTI